MATHWLERIQRASAWHPLYFTLLLLVTSLLTWTALVVPNLIDPGAIEISVGDVAPQDIRAPAGISYQSQVLTEQQRQLAAQSVSPVYSPPDASHARRQVERLRAALSFISNVRADAYATPEQKLDDLSALEDIQLSSESAESILALSDARWQVVQQEAIVVLEQVMRASIRDFQLEDARRNVPALVSLALPENQAQIVAEVVSGFVAPNSLYNEELTEAARQQAREAVGPVTRSFQAGETIVERGRVLTPSDLEALERSGLLQSEDRWQEMAGAAVLVLLCLGYATIYVRFRPRVAQDVRGMTLLALIFLAFLFGARLAISGRTVLPYLFPLSAFGLVVGILFGTRYGLAFAIPLSLLVTYDLPNGLGLTIYHLFGALFGVLTLGRGKRITAFIWAGVAVAATSAATLLVYRLPDPNTDLVGLATLTGASALNGLASAGLAILLQFFLAQLLGLTTALQLLDLSRPDQPLLQFILRNAPGTYQHSLQVSNLAEQAAERIGADALLTRVGALYHDAGKALNPHFYIENQVPGFANPHDSLDPYDSAEIILRHVTDGLDLARKHRLPRRIHDFIAEHHGTLITRYQFAQALKAAGGDDSRIDLERFRYPGPRPQSRETALLMLADGCEARVRAERPNNETALINAIKSTVDARLADGQLDDTPLTTQDLSAVVDVFTATLRGVYHPRIQYPKVEQKDAPPARTDGRDGQAQPDPVPQSDQGTTASG